MSAFGGLWKTTNRGITFSPIFDDNGVFTLCCIAIDPKDSNVLWLGTGENNSQRSAHFGDGIYKSTDAGKTWKRMGLETSEHIGDILIDPRNSNVVYVASQGPLFSEGGERGLYKTTDGGATWSCGPDNQQGHRHQRHRRSTRATRTSSSPLPTSAAGTSAR